MIFDNEKLFEYYVKNNGLNLFLGAGFSVLAKNSNGEPLPLGEEINQKLIDLFELDKSRKFTLSKTCQKINLNKENVLVSILKDIYTVADFDKKYLSIFNLPIKNIITTNVDNLIEKIFDSKESNVSLSDTQLNGYFEKNNVINLFKLHGSVTYPLEYKMTFSIEDLNNLFIKDKQLFDAVSYKIASIPTLFWGTRMEDGNILQILASSCLKKCSKNEHWVIVYGNDLNIIDDYRELGYNVISSSTEEMLEYFSKKNYCTENIENVSHEKKFQYAFPNNYVSVELQNKSIKRPVVEFFSGAEPMISDIMSNNVCKTSYFKLTLEKVIKNNVTLITGIPGSGKSTLLMQLAFLDDINGDKFWFNSIIKTEAERLNILLSNGKKAYVFVDNLYSNIEAIQVLQSNKNIKLVVAERPLNYEYVKRFFDISKDAIIDISNLIDSDVQKICTMMNRTNVDYSKIVENNENVSLLEIVFYVSTSSMVDGKIKSYAEDLDKFIDNKLKLNLLELYTLVNYTSYCGIPCSMDMLYFYFVDSIDDYTDILYALDKMNKIIVESSECDLSYGDQNYMVMRSKMLAEKSLNIIDTEMISKVLNNFLKNVDSQIIFRYDTFKKKAYDADITNRVFGLQDGIKFYENVLEVNQFNVKYYIRHQYAIFLMRKKKYDLAWKQIDMAYTESNKKNFTIANTHAIIMFEMNIDSNASSNSELKILKATIEKSFETLEYCITKDVRVNYHIIVYARNAYRYYNKFKNDEHSKTYIVRALNQIEGLLNSNIYIYKYTRRELIELQRKLLEIQNEL